MSQRAYVVAVISFCTTQETIRLLNGSNGRDNITGIISLNKHTLCNSKEVVMHYINEFLFDSARLLLFRDTVSEDTILNVTREYDRDASAQPLDLQFNADEMSMDTFALSSAGICLSFNCNLRCRYCGYSSEENDPNMLQFEDVKVFIRDIVRRRTIKKLITQKDDPLEIELTGGGEPTYNWELFCESIRFIKGLCKENRIPVQLRLTTNGMISENQADFVAANIDHTMISYDGLPDIQSRNRFSPYEKASNEKVEQTIRRLAANGASMVIRSTIWQDDLNRITDMYYHVRNLVAPRKDVVWSIYPVLFEGRAIKHIQHQGNAACEHFFTKCLGLMKDMSNQDDLLIDISLLNNGVYPFFCGAHKATKPWLLPDKSIATCIESKEYKTYIGKIENGFVQYFTHYQDPLLSIAQKKYYECQDCIAYSTCKGGCPIWHFRVDDKIREPLECSLQKKYWSYVVHALTSGEYSMGWKLEKIDSSEANGLDCFKVVKERAE